MTAKIMLEVKSMRHAIQSPITLNAKYRSRSLMQIYILHALKELLEFFFNKLLNVLGEALNLLLHLV